MGAVGNIISGIFKGGSEGGIVTQISNAVDKFVTTTEEKEKLKQETLRIIQDHEAKMQNELTERLRIDMNSDSWLSKNIRPMLMIFTTAIVVLFAFTDGNINVYSFHFKVKDEYISLFQALMTLQYTFYYGSRGVEKIMQTVASYKINRK